MLAFVFRYCVLDGLPIETSAAYKLMVSLHGQLFADLMTYEEEAIVSTHPPPIGRDTFDRRDTSSLTEGYTASS